MLNGFLPDDAVECFLDDDGDGDGDNLKERKLMKLCFLKSKNETEDIIQINANHLAKSRARVEF